MSYAWPDERFYPAYEIKAQGFGWKLLAARLGLNKETVRRAVKDGCIRRGLTIPHGNPNMGNITRWNRQPDDVVKRPNKLLKKPVQRVCGCGELFITRRRSRETCFLRRCNSDVQVAA